MPLTSFSLVHLGNKTLISIIVTHATILRLVAFDVIWTVYEKVQVNNDQEKAQSERNPHSKKRGGQKLNRSEGVKYS